MTLRTLVLTASSAAALLLVVVAAVRWLEPRFAFFPSAGERATPRDYGLEYEALSIATADGEQLHGWWLKHPSSRASILYFHGNGGSLSMWAPILAGIALRGYSLLAVDYRGYGLSTGRPTEQGLYRDVDAIVSRFVAGTSADRRVYWGRSLGVAMASYAATIDAPDGLILESGFPSVRSLLRGSPVLFVLSLMSTYRFPSAAFLQRRSPRTPVLIVHGEDDRIVPIAQGRALLAQVSEPKQFVAIRGGDHNDATPAEPATYWRAVDGFIAGLRC